MTQMQPRDHRFALSCRMLFLSLTAFGAAACGGGATPGGGNSPAGGAVSLAQLSDAAREAANAQALLGDFDPTLTTLAPGENAPFSTASSAKSASAQAKAATTSACRDGGTQTVEDADATRTFSYFNVTLAVSADRTTYSDCTLNYTANGTTTATQIFSGLAEEGGGTADTSDEYRYLVAGNSSADYTIEVDTGTGEQQTREVFGLRGLVERATLNDRRVLITRGLGYRHRTQTGSGQAVEYRATLGDGADFRYEALDTGFILISGPVAYSSTKTQCAGGSVTVATPQALRLGDPGNGSTAIIAGQLSLASGNASLRISFNSDGSAMVDFGNGRVEALSAAMLADANSAQVCRDAG